MFFGAVLVLSFLLLMAVFRSLLVPLKAVVMNMLSIAAAYGVVVAIFQWGWLADVVGIGQGAPIEPFIPMMMFAVVFGLSMDYEVFLLSADQGGVRAHRRPGRIGGRRPGRHGSGHHRGGGDHGRGVRQLRARGRPGRQAVRHRAATAVVLDATLVRMLLVPATMELLGARNWWFPRWLDRLIPERPGRGPHRRGKLQPSPSPSGAGDEPQLVSDVRGEPSVATGDPAAAPPPPGAAPSTQP